jgi:hypothetical protein
MSGLSRVKTFCSTRPSACCIYNTIYLEDPDAKIAAGPRHLRGQDYVCSYSWTRTRCPNTTRSLTILVLLRSTDGDMNYMLGLCKVEWNLQRKGGLRRMNLKRGVASTGSRGGCRGEQVRRSANIDYGCEVRKKGWQLERRHWCY